MCMQEKKVINTESNSLHHVVDYARDERVQSELCTVLGKKGIEDRKKSKLRSSPRSITLLPSNRCFVRQARVMTSEIKATKPLHCHKL